MASVLDQIKEKASISQAHTALVHVFNGYQGQRVRGYTGPCLYIPTQQEMLLSLGYGPSMEHSAEYFVPRCPNRAGLRQRVFKERGQDSISNHSWNMA